MAGAARRGLASEKGGANGTGIGLCWLVSPLGPYVNIAAGAARLPWLRFVIPAFLGEIIWISIYTGLGYWFSGQVVEIYNILGNASGFLAALALTIGLGIWLRSALRAGTRNSQNKP